MSDEKLKEGAMCILLIFFGSFDIIILQTKAIGVLVVPETFGMTQFVTLYGNPGNFSKLLTLYRRASQKSVAGDRYV